MPAWGKMLGYTNEQVTGALPLCSSEPGWGDQYQMITLMAKMINKRGAQEKRMCTEQHSSQAPVSTGDNQRTWERVDGSALCVQKNQKAIWLEGSSGARPPGALQEDT